MLPVADPVVDTEALEGSAVEGLPAIYCPLPCVLCHLAVPIIPSFHYSNTPSLYSFFLVPPSVNAQDLRESELTTGSVESEWESEDGREQLALLFHLMIPHNYPEHSVCAFRGVAQKRRLVCG